MQSAGEIAASGLSGRRVWRPTSAMCNDCSSLRIVKSTSWRQISYIKCVPPYVALQHIIQHLHGLCSRFALSEARKTSRSRAAPRGEKRGREKGRGKPRTPPRLPPASERARREREDRQWWGFASKQEVIHLEVRRTLGWKNVADYKLKFGPRCAIRSALLRRTNCRQSGDLG